MRPSFTPAELAFRDEVRAVVAAATPAASMQFFHGRGGDARALYRQLGERGWLSMTWPAQHGGRALPAVYEFLLWDEVAFARAARPDLGPGIVAKTLLEQGTEQQLQTYLPAIARGETGFSLGYSEPDAGSDLRSVRTRAVATGDGYVVTGEKCWTSDAHNSSFLWLLCRAEPGSHGPGGLTILIVPLDAPGVTISPISTIDGHRLNQVFLDEVVVPDTDRVGAEGDAWRLIREALAVERHLQLLPGRLRRDLQELTGWLIERGRYDSPHVRSCVAGLAVRLAQVEVHVMATLAALESGGHGVVEASSAKLHGSELAQAIARAAVDLGGPEALTSATTLGFLWPQSFMETIAGGTSEILLGIIARQALGLSSAS